MSQRKPKKKIIIDTSDGKAEEKGNFYDIEAELKKNVKFKPVEGVKFK